ncbi:MAG TPA: uracil-DNA glycosylase [Candidatus Limnocylindria bacterium]|nr:uracil-DNA glycosylase [Candidatus Limnocylindria bacterium]
MTEERHGSAGAGRAPGGLGGPSRSPILADALAALASTLRFHRDMGVQSVALTGEYLRSPGQALREQEERRQGCRACKLCDGRNSIVFGSGNPQADLVVIGEGPGADEDAQGLPFVGRAGQLLTKMLDAVHLSRDDVYICNTVKCRPPGNRNPEPDELAACAPFLAEQLAAIQPKVILALGSVATQALLKTKETIGRLRGRLHPYGDAVLVPTFHPAFLLRNPGQEYKRLAWDDLKLARREYDQRRTP